jgi:hypothetical protein
MIARMGMAGRRALWFTLAFVGLLLFVAAVALFSSSGPRYEGRSLDYWLERGQRDNVSPADVEKAQAAIFNIATNNLPLFLKWFVEPEPAQSDPGYINVINDLLSHQKLLAFRLEPTYHESRPSMAESLFLTHPEVARSALPQFLGMLTNQNNAVKGRAGRVIVQIGEPAIPALMPLLSSPNVVSRMLAASILGEIGLDDIHLRPRLEAMMWSDNYPSVRIQAARAAGQLGEDPAITIPVLIQSYQEGDRQARERALAVLAELRSRAAPAIPFLTNAIATTTNAENHRMLRSTLRNIAPMEAVKYGAPIPNE